MGPAGRAWSDCSTVPLLQNQPSYSVQRSGLSSSSIPGAVPLEVLPLQYAGPRPYPNGYCPSNPGMLRSPSWPLLPQGSTYGPTGSHHAPPGPHGESLRNPDTQNRPRDQSNILNGKLPLFVTVLNILSVLVIILNAPMAAWFSYFLFFMAPILIGAPLGSFCAVVAVYLPKWGYKTGLIKRPQRMIKLMKFFAMTALTFDGVGAIFVPLLMFSTVCPHVGFDRCPHDVPLARALSVLVAFIVFIHGILCIMLRIYATSVVTAMVGEDQMRLAMDQENEGVGLSPLPTFQGGGNGPPSLSFTSLPCYRPSSGVPIFPPRYQPMPV